jgi:chromate transporter
VTDNALQQSTPSWRRSTMIMVFGTTLWMTPVLIAALLTGRDSVFTEQGLFFSGTALVTFGGAYAVLAFVAQRAVEVYGWLSPGEMIKGLALAETTPGPLIMVVQFVAFLGAYRDPGGLNPAVAGVIASLLTTWVTFVPCFMWIYLGAPYIERLRNNSSITAALSGITAAVVGVIANLALYFAVHTLFTGTRVLEWSPVRLLAPVWKTYTWESWLIAGIAMMLIFPMKWSVLKTLGTCALLGIVLGLAF